MGYETETTNEGRFCIFPDGSGCEMEAIYNGECGQEYVKDLGCSKEGNYKLPGRPCCPGLVAKPQATVGTNGACHRKTTWGVCLPCGNGICNKSENICNCPEDCEAQSLPKKLNQHLNNLNKNIIFNNNGVKKQLYIFGGITGTLAVISVILIKKNTK